MEPGGAEQSREATGLWMTKQPSRRWELLRRNQRVEDQAASGKGVSWCGRRRWGVKGVEVMEVAVERIEERRQHSDHDKDTPCLGRWGRQSSGGSSGGAMLQSALVDD